MNLDKNTLIEQYTSIKMQIEKLEEALEPIKQQLTKNAQLIGEQTEKGWKIDGEYFRLTINTQSMKTINADLLKANLGLTDDQIAFCKKETIFERITYKAI